MGLRDQPYLSLYVQDFLTDEKLAECSAESTGVYIRLMCLMHKSDEYGAITLKQKDLQNVLQNTLQSTLQNDIQNSYKIKAFVKKLVRQMPYDEVTIERALVELIDEEVLMLDGNRLYQKRMVRDGNLSAARAEAVAQRKDRQKKQQNNNSEKDFVNSFVNDFVHTKPDTKCSTNDVTNAPTNDKGGIIGGVIENENENDINVSYVERIKDSRTESKEDNKYIYINNINSSATTKQTASAMLDELAAENGFSATLTDKLHDWIEYKRERRDKPYQQKGFKALINMVQKNVTQYGERAVCDVIDASMAACYQGITWDRLKQKGDRGNGTNTSANDTGTVNGAIPTCGAYTAPNGDEYFNGQLIYKNPIPFTAPQFASSN